MKRLIAALLLVSVLSLLAANLGSARQELQPPRFLSNKCGTFTRKPHVIGQAYHPLEINVAFGVKCMARVAYIKITGCLIRYGQANDPTPKVGQCKSATSLLDDQIGSIIRYKCIYTTTDYLWILEMSAVVRGLSGKRGAGTDFSWPVESRCL